MRKIYLWVVLLLSFSARAQYTLRLVVKDDATKLPLAGATAIIAGEGEYGGVSFRR
jgi:hypothetical protein